MSTTNLPTRQLGSLEVTVVGLGCNNFGGRIDEDATGKVVDAALEVGINFFDTADVYGNGGLSETFLGRSLMGRREKAIIATKFGMSVAGIAGGARPEYLREALKASLQRLQTDHVDLYQLHKPDPAVPVAETLGALGELVVEGVVREIGCSNFSAGQLAEADRQAGPGARFVSVQNEYSLLHRKPEEEGVLDVCEELGIGFLPYFPLHSGILTGKYRKGEPLPMGTRVTGNSRWEDRLTDELFDTIEGLVDVADAHGKGLTDLAFAWLLAKPQVSSVIAGATSPDQVRANAATASWTLDESIMAEVEEVLGSGV